MKFRKSPLNYKIRNIIEILYLSIILIVGVSSGLTIVNTEDNIVLFLVENETYLIEEKMDFDQIKIDSSFITFNNTGFHVSSDNSVIISLVYINKNIRNAGDGELILEFYADISSGNVWFNISGFPVSNEYIVRRDGVRLSHSRSEGSNFISFSCNIAGNHQFRIIQFGEGSENNPPYIPSRPSGPPYAGIGSVVDYSTSTFDPDYDQVYYKWDWGDNIVSDWIGPFGYNEVCTSSHSWTHPGNYSIKVKTKDVYDAESGWSQEKFVIVADTGLNVYAGDSYFGFESESIQFYGSVSGGIEPYSWYWDFGDGVGISTQQNPRYVFGRTGDYSVSLTVTDNIGDSDTDYTEVHVVPDGSLLVNSNGPYNGKVGYEVGFRGSVSGGNQPYSFRWDFGDGDVSSKQNPTHVYGSKGQYSVVFTVNDNKGFTRDDVTIATISEEGGDIYPPSKVRILSPQGDSIYFFGNKLTSFVGTLIIGSIDVEVVAYDEESGIDHVEFYVDGDLKSTDFEVPYMWTWGDICFSRYTLKVIAFDNAGNWAPRWLIVWKFF